MDKKLVITALYNEKKSIKYEQPLFKKKDGGMYMNFTESIITQMVKARDEDEFKAICERIQDFIEREGIDVCFAINQNELLDCLNEHQKLKLQIEQLEHRLANSIELPVKIGDTIYVIPSETNYKINIVNKHEERNKVYKFIVNEIRYNQYGYSVVSWVDNIPFFFLNGDKKTICECFETERFYNETWFITEAEAKAKLEKLKNG